MAINPFIWDRPLQKPEDVVGMDAFAEEIALTLKARTNVALFGARNTGKSSFLAKLEHELEKEHQDAAAHVVIRIDLKRALSIPAFIAAVHDGMTSHPHRQIRDRVREQLGVLEKEVGFDIRVVKATVRKGRTEIIPTEMLHEQLASLARLSENVVVIFDEFQRLNRCPDDPLAIIGSALMGHRANHVSLVFTGSIREYLEMMLTNSNEPIFNQAVHKQLPKIERHALFAFLETKFAQSNSPANEDAIDFLLHLSEGHPQRTQQLAWQAWPKPTGGKHVALSDISRAWEELLAQPNADVAIIEEALGNGGEPETTERKALYLLADHAGENLTSVELAERYGLRAHTTAKQAMPRLRRRGLVQEHNGQWEIIDPLLAAWLKKHSPFATTPNQKR